MAVQSRKSSQRRTFRLAVLASGNGSNLQALIDSVKKKKLKAEIEIVISNNSNAFALKRARRNGIKALHLSRQQFKSQPEFDRKLVSTLKKQKIDLICLAGYMKKLSPSVVKAFRNKIINIHPAPLPRFGGKGMYGLDVHRAVIHSGVKNTAVSVHLVDYKFDHGPVIYSEMIPLKKSDTPVNLQKRVLKVEHRVYPYIAGLFADGKVAIKGRKVVIKNQDASK
ncbi:MAG: phosphoribosylglycinamide formyltransferase [candidate division Zixibacteria bacterium]|nr:phosphoribosylglycinamide formyltransferase [candidate division Zixibacteria bacterium]